MRGFTLFWLVASIVFAGAFASTLYVKWLSLNPRAGIELSALQETPVADSDVAGAREDADTNDNTEQTSGRWFALGDQGNPDKQIAR